jgi:Na+/H+ antiporter NhaA
MHLPFLFLEILVCLIQAFVFALLAAIYIGMMLPHEEHDHEHEQHDEFEREHDNETVVEYVREHLPSSG